MIVNTYSFLDTVAAISGPNGAFSLIGGNSDEGITTEQAEDKNQMTPGAEGSVMHSLHAANHGTCTLRFLKISPINAQLNQLYNGQRASSALWGKNVITVSDPVRGDSVSITGAAFKKHTPVTQSKDGNSMEWPFDCASIVIKLGSGSPSL